MHLVPSCVCLVSVLLICTYLLDPNRAGAIFFLPFGDHVYVFLHLKLVGSKGPHRHLSREPDCDLPLNNPKVPTAIAIQDGVEVDNLAWVVLVAILVCVFQHYYTPQNVRIQVGWFVGVDAMPAC